MPERVATVADLLFVCTATAVATLLALWLVARHLIRRDRHAALADTVGGEQRFRGIFESSPDPMFIVDPSGDRIVDANSRAVSLLGYEHRELVGMRISEVHPGEMAKLLAFAGEISARGAATTDQLSCLTKHGTRIPAEISGAFVDDTAGRRLLIAQVRDLTPRLVQEERRRKLEQELIQSHKMEAVGRLAGGIAHDFNNMLMVINGSAEMILDQEVSAAVRRSADAVLQAGTRASHLTGGLLAFSRKQALKPESLDINHVVEGMAGLLSRMIGEHISIATDLGEGALYVTMDRAQLDQVVLNLALNARDAMPSGGTLAIETRVAARDEIDARLLGPGDFVVLTVRDSGAGIDPAIRDRIFEPFFTTKDVGAGTGLGLATVHGIVGQSGGAVAVDSAPDAGTRFAVFLPRSRASESAPSGVGVAAVGEGGSKRVLVVEDDALVRDLVSRTLTQHGYAIRVAADGREALERFREQMDVDLVLTDVVMPSMGGVEFVSAAREIKPPLRVVFMTGYTDPIAEAELGAPVLRKPFSLRELVEAVCAAVESDGRGRAATAGRERDRG